MIPYIDCAIESGDTRALSAKQTWGSDCHGQVGSVKTIRRWIGGRYMMPGFWGGVEPIATMQIIQYESFPRSATFVGAPTEPFPFA